MKQKLKLILQVWWSTLTPQPSVFAVSPSPATSGQSRSHKGWSTSSFSLALIGRSGGTELQRGSSSRYESPLQTLYRTTGGRIFSRDCLCSLHRPAGWNRGWRTSELKCYGLTWCDSKLLCPVCGCMCGLNAPIYLHTDTGIRNSTASSSVCSLRLSCVYF